MTKVSKSLILEFFDGKRKNKHSLKITNAQSDLGAKEVKEAMEQIASFNLFEDKEGEMMFSYPLSARYVLTNTDELFDEDK